MLLTSTPPPGPALPAPSATFVYSPRSASCTIPPGTTLNTTTVAVTGILTTAGDYTCQVDIAIANNSVSWTISPNMHVIANN